MMAAPRRETGLTEEERAVVEQMTRRAREAHDRFVRELDGLLYDLQTYTERQRGDMPPPEGEERGRGR